MYLTYTDTAEVLLLHIQASFSKVIITSRQVTGYDRNALGFSIPMG